MRAFDRDLIRGGHYGQRSCEPHAKAEHMAAPTKTALVKKVLANPEPSTHDPKQTLGRLHIASAVREAKTMSNEPKFRHIIVRSECLAFSRSVDPC
jgi:hypothetical protein